MQQLILPDLLALCPLKGSTNLHYKAAAAESRAWVNSYNVLTGEKRTFFNQGSNELLVSHTYPYADYEQFRTCCDFINLLFVVDEVSDDQSGKDARATGMVYLNVMWDPSWDDGSVLAQMTREFRARFTRLANPACQRRFMRHCEDYIEAVAKEAEYRERGEVLSMPAFETLRRENSAIRLCFGLFEYALGVQLPDQVFKNPVFMSLYWAGTDMVCWANDVYSYKMEQAKGHLGNNIVTILQKAKGIDLQAASDYVGVHFKKLMDRFNADKQRLPSWGPEVDGAVAAYVAGIEHWIIGNLEWSFETQRYFGPAHAEIKRTRTVVLSSRTKRV